MYFLLNFLLEHVVSIIANMLRNCRGTQRQRLLSKFTENDHEKVDRLLELHFKYLDKVEEIDARIERQRKVFIFFYCSSFICSSCHVFNTHITLDKLTLKKT